MLRARWTPSPCDRLPGLGLPQVLRPIPGIPADDGPSADQLAAGRERGLPRWFPFTLGPLRRGRRQPLCPCNMRRLRREAFTVASRWATSRYQEFSPPKRRSALLPSPDLLRFELGGLLLRGVQPLVLHITPFVLASWTRTILTVLARPVVVKARPHPPRRPRFRLPSKLSVRCDEQGGRCSSPPRRVRPAGLVGGHPTGPHLVRRGGDELWFEVGEGAVGLGLVVLGSWLVPQSQYIVEIEAR